MINFIKANWYKKFDKENAILANWTFSVMISYHEFIINGWISYHNKFCAFYLKRACSWLNDYDLGFPTRRLRLDTHLKIQMEIYFLVININLKKTLVLEILSNKNHIWRGKLFKKSYRDKSFSKNHIMRVF